MREDEHDDSMPGQDSFVDVVCNMVGILIVLVVILGVRSAGTAPEKRVPVTSSLSGNSEGMSKVGQSGVTRAKIGQSCVDLDEAIVHLDELAMQAALTQARRDELTVVLTAVQTEIADRRSKLDKEGQRQFDVQAEIAAANIKLHNLTQEQIRLIATSTQVEEVEHVPTALGKTVTGDVMHVRLAHGNLAVVPANKLMDQSMMQSRDYLRDQLHRRDRANVVHGPVDGFFMKFILEKEDADDAMPGGYPAGDAEGTALYQAALFAPTSSHIGEPVDQALQADSEFMRVLAANRATAQAVVVWVYPDSYEELRTLKKALWEMNISIVVIPRNHDQLIKMGSRGARPRAQ
jgi:hypothetical protein